MTPIQILTSALEDAYLEGAEDGMEGSPQKSEGNFKDKAREFAHLKTSEVLAKTAEFMRNNCPSSPKGDEDGDGFSFSLPFPIKRRVVVQVLEKLWANFRQLDAQGLAELQGIDPMAFLEACNESQDPRIQRNLNGCRRLYRMV